MRALVLFALALAGTVASTTDASAFGRRRAAAAATSSEGCNGGGYVSNYGGCYGSGYGAYGSGSCYGSGYSAYSAGSCYGSGYGTVMSSGCYGSGYASSNYGGCYGSRSAGYSAGSYSGSGYAQSGYSYSGSVAYSYPASYSVAYSNGSYNSRWMPMTVSGGQASVFQATDGTYYALGSDGVYRPAYSNGVMMLNGVAMPYASGTTYSSSSYTPAGSATTTTSSGVIQAGGTSPLSTTSTFRAKQMLGTQILLGNNTQVGTVADMVTDGAGNLDYLIVSTSDNKLVTVPFDAAKFDSEKKTATINITQDVWKTVPTYTTTTYPQFYTPTYRTDIFKVFGLTPRELRRIP